MKKREKIEQIIKKYPHLFDEMIVLSEDEAEALLEEEGYLSFAQMITAAKEKSELPMAHWAAVDAVLAKNASKHHTRGGMRRRWGVTVVATALVLTIGFFTLVPAGRSIAKSIYNWAAQLIGNTIVITEKDPKDIVLESTPPEEMFKDVPKVSSGIEEGDIVKYDSIEAAEEAIGVEIFTLEHPDFVFSYVEEHKHSKDIYISYVIKETGEELGIWQEWDHQNITDMPITTNMKKINRKMVLNKQYELFYGEDKIDGSWSGVMLWKDKVIIIGMPTTVYEQSVLDALK
ncbi:MAG: hypothetical protein ACOX3W_04990 [Christensenellaceae bacterium]